MDSKWPSVICYITSIEQNRAGVSRERTNICASKWVAFWHRPINVSNASSQTNPCQSSTSPLARCLARAVMNPSHKRGKRLGQVHRAKSILGTCEFLENLQPKAECPGRGLQLPSNALTCFTFGFLSPCLVCYVLVNHTKAHFYTFQTRKSDVRFLWSWSEEFYCSNCVRMVRPERSFSLTRCASKVTLRKWH